jgi:hypothetical protein
MRVRSHTRGVDNAYIIEVWIQRQDEPARPIRQRWVGIAPSAEAMIALLPGERPSVVSRGADVLALARRLGLEPGEVRKLDNRVARGDLQ